MLRSVSRCFSSIASSSVRAREDRIRRALFSVPGADSKKITKASQLQPDSVVLDLEDGVAFDKKEKARELVLDALNGISFGRSELCVRINDIRSGLALADLSSVLRSPNLRAIVIPKVEYASDILFVETMIANSAHPEAKDKIQLLAAVESAVGLLNLREIASAGERLAALIFASEDLCANMGLMRTPSARELLFARSNIVVHAVANNLQAIDMVCMDFKDDARLAQECQEGFEMGFTGKQAIHPNQIATINSKFRPSEETIKKARLIVDGYKEHTSRGVGAFDLNGQVIDLPVVKWAERILRKAELN